MDEVEGTMYVCINKYRSVGRATTARAQKGFKVGLVEREVKKMDRNN